MSTRLDVRDFVEVTTPRECTLYVMKPDQVSAQRQLMKAAIEEVRESLSPNIILFQELAFPAGDTRNQENRRDYDLFLQEISGLAENPLSYIVAGSYHDVVTERNVCLFFSANRDYPYRIDKMTSSHRQSERIVTSNCAHGVETDFGVAMVTTCLDIDSEDVRNTLYHMNEDSHYKDISILLNPSWNEKPVEGMRWAQAASADICVPVLFVNNLLYGDHSCLYVNGAERPPVQKCSGSLWSAKAFEIDNSETYSNRLESFGV